MGSNRMSLFKEINVWRLAEGGGLIRYRCFENLTNNRFQVRNADFFKEPVTQEELDGRDAYFYDFLADALADGASEEYESLEKAIQTHEKDFS